MRTFCYSERVLSEDVFPMRVLFKKFIANENGATAIEYGLIAALISVVIIGVLTTVGGNLKADFTSVATALR
jgi:pilus assembly protein Flp/PilA